MQEKHLRFFAKSACRVFQDEQDWTTRGDSGDRQLWSLTLAVNNLPRNLPYGPNARNARLDAKPAKAMLNTLESEPENFIYYNNGIMLVVGSFQAKRVEGGHFDIRIAYTESSDSDDELDRFLGHGVLNGGHTYKALTHALDGPHSPGEFYPKIDRAFVQVTVAVGINEDNIASISRARNLSKPVPDYALKNLNGDWEGIRVYLPMQCRPNVVFKPEELEGDLDRRPVYTVVDLVQRLALLNNDLFPWRSDKSSGVRELHPLAAYTGKGSLIARWAEENYRQVLPLLPDILWLEEKVMEAHQSLNGHGNGKVAISKVSGCDKRPCTLITGKSFSLTVAAPFVMPVMAAFRVLLKDGRWIAPKEELWDKYGVRLVKKLWEEYKSEGRSSAASFGRSKSTWITLVNEITRDFVQI